MKTKTSSNTIAMVLGAAAICVTLSSVCAMECPSLKPFGGSAGVPTDLEKQLASTDVLAQIPGIVSQLHQQTPAAPKGEIVDYLVAAYCPVVKADSRLSEQERQAKVREFTNAVVATEY